MSSSLWPSADGQHSPPSERTFVSAKICLQCINKSVFCSKCYNTQSKHMIVLSVMPTDGYMSPSYNSTPLQILGKM